MKISAVTILCSLNNLDDIIVSKLIQQTVDSEFDPYRRLTLTCLPWIFIVIYSLFL